MFRLANPLYLLLFIPLAIAVWLMFVRRKSTGMIYSATNLILQNTWSLRMVLNNTAPFLFIAGLSCAVIGLSRPQIVLSESAKRTDAIAVEIAVDISGSMEALDFSTKTEHKTRLDVVKETFAEFIRQRPNDLIGLVVFGGYAYSKVPLTIDYNALLHTLKATEVPEPLLNKQGQILNEEERLTAIGDGLATACARLEQAKVKSKIIVLLSDGESNTGIIKPEEAMNAAKELGIKVYTIGVGSTGMVPFKTTDLFGRDVIQRARVSLDEALLRKIAKETGGVYFNVKNPHGLKKAMKEINKLEKTEIQQKVYYQYNELFPCFLIPAVILILTAVSCKLYCSKEII
jgi:Ca-activated chloride channel homolog